MNFAESIKVQNALGEMGIVLWYGDYFVEEKEAALPLYMNYLHLPLLIYTGLWRMENFAGPDENASFPGDLYLINSIAKHFLSSGDPFLEKVAWDNFWTTARFKGSVLGKLARKKKWALCKGDWSLFLNKTPDIYTEHLVISPFSEENIIASEDWDYVKEFRRKSGPILVPPNPFSPRAGHGNIVFQIAMEDEKDAIGALILTQREMASPIYEAKVHLLDGYRGKGYEEEALASLLMAIREKRICIFSEREYRKVYEEYSPEIALVNAYADEEEESIYLHAGMKKMGRKTVALKEGDSFIYREKTVFSFLNKEER